MGLFALGLIGASILGSQKKKRAKRRAAYEAEIKGPDQTDFGQASDSAGLGSVKWAPRRSSTIYQSKKYAEGRRVYNDTISAPTLYGGAMGMAPPSPGLVYGGLPGVQPGQNAVDPMTGLPQDYSLASMGLG